VYEKLIKNSQPFGQKISENRRGGIFLTHTVCSPCNRLSMCLAIKYITLCSLDIYINTDVMLYHVWFRLGLEHLSLGSACQGLGLGCELLSLDSKPGYNDNTSTPNCNRYAMIN